MVAARSVVAQRTLKGGSTGKKLTPPPEPEIFVQGVELTPAQAMTVRVCLEVAQFDCGEDQLGKAIQRNYKARAYEVLALMHGPLKV
jgi:hypothetical protein